MQLILQTGAHFTEQERLIKSVLRNKDDFARRGITVPGPNSYRALVRDTLNAMSKSPAAPQAREVLLDVILDNAPADRVILSDANFFRTAGTAIQEGVLYPAAAKRMAHMADIFAEDELEIYLALRNPATLIPILFENAIDQSDAAFWGPSAPQDIRWSDTIAAIRQAAPSIPITCWCAEDAPLLWATIIREMAGIDQNEQIVGGFDLLTTIMSKEGMERLRAYLHGHNTITPAQRYRVIAAFLDKFALEDEIEEELDMPGWTEPLVDELTELYDQDVAVIEAIPGVRIIAP